MISPIVLDLTDTGYNLSDSENGVWFHVLPDTATDYRIPWPAAGSHNGWLVLDRNANGLIDDFGEFFGDLTQQPSPPLGQHPNGFLALAVFDQPDQGGNGDGRVSKDDRIYQSLRIWVDANRDGISQPAELFTLDSLDIASIDLKYETSEKTDRYGNLFRYRGRIRDSSGGEAKKVIYDVFLRMGGSRIDDSAASWFSTPSTSGFIEDARNLPRSNRK